MLKIFYLFGKVSLILFYFIGLRIQMRNLFQQLVWPSLSIFLFF